MAMIIDIVGWGGIAFGAVFCLLAYERRGTPIPFQPSQLLSAQPWARTSSTQLRIEGVIGIVLGAVVLLWVAR